MIQRDEHRPANGLPKVKVALYMILHAESYCWMRAFEQLMIKLSLMIKGR